MYPRVSPEKGPRVPGGACDGDVPAGLPPRGSRCARRPRPPGRGTTGESRSRRPGTDARTCSPGGAMDPQGPGRREGAGPVPTAALRARGSHRPAPCALRRETELQTRGVPCPAGAAEFLPGRLAPCRAPRRFQLSREEEALPGFSVSRPICLLRAHPAVVSGADALSDGDRTDHPGFGTILGFSTKCSHTLGKPSLLGELGRMVTCPRSNFLGGPQSQARRPPEQPRGGRSR